MLFFLVLSTISCKQTPPLLQGYDKTQLFDTWWELQVNNDFVANRINDTYGYPPCFSFESERNILFITNEKEYWSYPYTYLGNNEFLIDNDIKITVDKIDSKETSWYVTVKENFFEYDGYAYDCTYISKNIQTSSLE